MSYPQYIIELTKRKGN
jgi:hypothetical protein